MRATARTACSGRFGTNTAADAAAAAAARCCCCRTAQGLMKENVLLRKLQHKCVGRGGAGDKEGDGRPVLSHICMCTCMYGCRSTKPFACTTCDVHDWVLTGCKFRGHQHQHLHRPWRPARTSSTALPSPHPGRQIVEYVGCGKWDADSKAGDNASLFVVEEYVDGGTLKSMVNRAMKSHVKLYRLQVGRYTTYCRPCCRALGLGAVGLVELAWSWSEGLPPLAAARTASQPEPYPTPHCGHAP
jgi:hypothetical protein